MSEAKKAKEDKKNKKKEEPAKMDEEGDGGTLDDLEEAKLEYAKSLLRNAAAIILNTLDHDDEGGDYGYVKQRAKKAMEKIEEADEILAEMQ